jgi:hypothetical protein
MRPTTLAIICVAGAVGSYLAWTAAVADDEPGLRHVAAIATGVLWWGFAIGFIAAVTRIAWRFIRQQRSGHGGA